VRWKGMGLLCGMAALSLALTQAEAQDAAAPSPAPPPAAAGSELLTGPATIATHWSRYKYPESIPEGALYYIIKRGDTLWDLSAKFLGNPFLWPQIWDQNRYITDAHWIYPGDPLIMPRIALISERAGEEGPGMGEEPGAEPGAGRPTREGDVLYPVIEEMALQCAQYVLQDPEDTNLYVVGSEQGATKIAFAERDILYLNKGSSAGIKAGDVYSLHHAAYQIKHPESGRTIGRKIETTGWARVILVEENSATVMVEQACIDIHLGDYLKPFQKVSVPLILRHAPPDRLTPPSGKTQGHVVDVGDDSLIAGTGQLVSVNLGTTDGLAPGTLLTVYKVMYPSVPTPRNVLGELAIVSVQERTATARVIYSSDAIMSGDRVELR